MQLPKTLQYNCSIHKTEEDLTDLSRELAMEYREVSGSIEWDNPKQQFKEYKKRYCQALLNEAQKVEEAFYLITKPVEVPEEYQHLGRFV